MQDKAVSAAAVEVVEGHHVDVVPHVPHNYPHFTPFIENVDQYRAMYKRSIEDPDGFWAEIAEEFHWEKKVGGGGTGGPAGGGCAGRPAALGGAGGASVWE
jgi:hypothetical protein